MFGSLEGLWFPWHLFHEPWLFCCALNGGAFHASVCRSFVSLRYGLALVFAKDHFNMS